MITASHLTTKTYLDLRHAAELAELSVKQFMRYVEKDHIPLIDMRGKFFILGRDFNQWQEERETR